MKNKTFIIAEAGVNHNGEIDLAKKLIVSAAQIGANAIKFQTFSAKKIVTKNSSLAKYQKKNTKINQTQYSLLKKLELNYSDHKTLIKCCKKNQIEFISSPFDLDSAKMLIKLGLRKIKIPSGEITNYQLLKYLSKLDIELIISTGMTTSNEIRDALKILTSKYKKKSRITLLHCNTDYPTDPVYINLRAINFLSDKFNFNVGFSDHSIGTHIPVAAIAFGAKVIEKHFTLKKSMQGPDHSVSLNPIEFRTMINNIRDIEKAIGNYQKKPTKSEIKNMVAVRKSIVAIKFINKGETFTYDNIGAKRPGKGISPMKIKEIIGKKAKKNFKEDDLIST